MARMGERLMGCARPDAPGSAEGLASAAPGCETAAMRGQRATMKPEVRTAPVAASLLAHLLRDFTREIGQDGALLRGIAAEAGDPAAAAFETALVAEALAHPALRREAPALAAALMACLVAMEDGGALPRGIGLPPLNIISDDPQRLDIRTATHAFSGNLRQGVLHQRLRATPGPGVQHGGAMIEFRLWGRAHCLDVEDAITEARVIRAPGLVRLEQVSAIAAPGRFGGAPRPVGRLAYIYEISAGSPWLRVTVRFDPAPGVAPQRLRLITACDGISDGTPFTLAEVEGAAVALAPGMVELHEGAVASVALRQHRAGGLRLELRPGAPGAVVNAKLSVRPDGAAHWLVLRHTPDAGGTVTEERLLLDRDTPDAAAIRRGWDCGHARGQGIALLAAARCLGMAGVAGAALSGFVARLLARLRAEPVLDALDAGFLVLAERALDEAPSLPRLLALERRAALADGLERGLYGDAPGQAAAIMALAELGEAIALARALAGLGVVSAPVTRDGQAAMAELPAVGGAPVADTLSLALLLRALGSVARARGGGQLTLDPATAARAARLEALYANLLALRLRGEGDGIAAADDALGGPASGAGQAAAMAAMAQRG